jgi:Ca2+/H+ antiporter
VKRSQGWLGLGLVPVVQRANIVPGCAACQCLCNRQSRQQTVCSVRFICRTALRLPQSTPTHLTLQGSPADEEEAPALSLAGALACLTAITAIVAVNSGEGGGCRVCGKGHQLLLCCGCGVCVCCSVLQTRCICQCMPLTMGSRPFAGCSCPSRCSCCGPLMCRPVPVLPHPEFLTGAIHAVSVRYDINQAFLGFIVLPIAGNVAEHVTVGG